MQIRVAEERDAAALAEIYSYYVEKRQLHLNMRRRLQRNLRSGFIT